MAIDACDRAEILDFNTVKESLCFFVRFYGSLRSINIKVANRGAVDSNIWPIDRKISYVSYIPLHGADSRVNEQENYCGNLNPKFLFIPGGLFLAWSIALLYKLWWKISFDFSANVSVVWFALQFCASLFLFVCGSLVLLSAIGIL